MAWTILFFGSGLLIDQLQLVIKFPAVLRVFTIGKHVNLRALGIVDLEVGCGAVSRSFRGAGAGTSEFQIL